MGGWRVRIKLFLKRQHISEKTNQYFQETRKTLSVKNVQHLHFFFLILTFLNVDGPFPPSQPATNMELIIQFRKNVSARVGNVNERATAEPTSSLPTNIVLMYLEFQLAQLQKL